MNIHDDVVEIRALNTKTKLLYQGNYEMDIGCGEMLRNVCVNLSYRNEIQGTQVITEIATSACLAIRGEILAS